MSNAKHNFCWELKTGRRISQSHEKVVLQIRFKRKVNLILNDIHLDQRLSVNVTKCIL